MNSNQPWRILLLTPSVRLLGARQSLLSIVKNFPSHILPHVVCSGSGDLTKALQDAQIPHSVIPHFPWRKFSGRLRSTFQQLPALRSLVREFKPSIIHCNEYHCTPQALRAASAAGFSVPVTVHMRNAPTQRHIQNYELRNATSIIAVSESIKPLFREQGLESRVQVIHNGIEVEQFLEAKPDPSLRQTLGWGSDVLVVGLLGLVSPRKAQLVLAEAVALANARGAQVRLLLAGDAFKSSLEYGEQLRARLAQPDLSTVSQWTPFQKEILPLYGSMDLNALISTEEGFGRTIIEAGALGIPSVGSRIGGIPEIILPNETGFLIDEGDVQALAQLLLQASNDREHLKLLGQNARERVVREFTLTATVEKLVRHWEALLA